MLVAALRRFSLLLVGTALATAVLSLLLGLAAGSGVHRSVSVGWYVVGSVLLISGFFVGNRGPARPQGEGWFPFSATRWVRWATPQEQQESISLSAILILLGFVLILLGIVADSRYKLF
jgi:hypothetical protein